MDRLDPPPAWDDLDAWRAQLRAAHGLEQRGEVAKRWWRAAGGTEVTNGVGQKLGHLPPDLRSCLAAAELRTLVRELKLAPY